MNNSELAGRIAAIRQAGDGAALLGMANLIERAVVEWATDVTPWVQVGLIAPDRADDLRTYPELMAHFVAEMKRLAQQLRTEAN